MCLRKLCQKFEQNAALSVITGQELSRSFCMSVVGLKLLLTCSLTGLNSKYKSQVSLSRVSQHVFEEQVTHELVFSCTAYSHQNAIYRNIQK